MTNHLRPDRHIQRDFFIADILDAAPKDDMASMEHPIFALRAGDRRIRNYERGNYKVEIQPGPYGCATIHDKDVWIYCISQLMEAVNRGRDDISRTVRFVAYDFLVTTNRPVAGVGYDRMADALRRLSGTRIETNIETDGKRERSGFGLIDSWKVVERRKDHRMAAVEVTLPDWLFRSVKARYVLTIDRDYFRLRKPLDRRIYEIARKHCGSQSRWRATVSTLHEKSGSTSTLREFRRLLKCLADSDELPGYRVMFNDDDDAITFYPKSGMRSAMAQARDLLKMPRK
ncbi:replication initiator protein A [Acidithiobacillus thiooxidans]|uniref:replication initiator protein A n=1 Tax=Acidithiobacillus thiooxidans TaxID=930 RepID=UPI00285F1AA0|nr:replication initiator protein A [Acidithiobacillus thiooxidans]MDR7926546.1 replication initiator protein A [Acidithiobacillus thiooxidans]